MLKKGHVPGSESKKPEQNGAEDIEEMDETQDARIAIDKLYLNVFLINIVVDLRTVERKIMDKKLPFVFRVQRYVCKSCSQNWWTCASPLEMNGMTTC